MTDSIHSCLDVDEWNPGPGVEVLEYDVASPGLAVGDLHLRSLASFGPGSFPAPGSLPCLPVRPRRSGTAPSAGFGPGPRCSLGRCHSLGPRKQFLQ